MIRSKAKIAVALAIGHESHYGYASRRVFELAASRHDWIDLEFYSENQSHELLADIQANQIDGVVFGSGSLQAAALLDLLVSESSSQTISKAYESGVGFAFLHQLPPKKDGSGVVVNLFGDQNAFAIRRGQQHPVCEIATQGETRVFGRRENSIPAHKNGLKLSYWSTHEPVRSEHWTEEMLCRRYVEDEQLTPVAWSNPYGESTLFISNVALDWTEDIESLSLVLEGVISNRGVLLITQDAGEPVNSRLDSILGPHQGRATFRIVRTIQELISSTRSGAGVRDVAFNDSIPLASDRIRDIDWIVMNRLERDGRVSGFIEPMTWYGHRTLDTLLTIEGPLDHAERAQWLANWLSLRRPNVRNEMTFDLRGLAVASSVLRDTYRDSHAIPSRLQVNQLAPEIREAVQHRLGESSNNIDGLAMPTLASAAALRALGVEDLSKRMQDWVYSKCKSPGDQQWLDDATPNTFGWYLVWLEDPPTELEIVREWLDSSLDPDSSVPWFLRAMVLSRSKSWQFDYSDSENRDLWDGVWDEALTDTVRAEICLFLLREEAGTPLPHLLRALGVVEEILDRVRLTSSLETVALASAAAASIDTRLGLRIFPYKSLQPHTSPLTEDAVNAATVDDLQQDLVSERSVTNEQRDEIELQGRQLHTASRRILGLLIALSACALIIYVAIGVFSVRRGWLSIEGAIAISTPFVAAFVTFSRRLAKVS